MCDLVTFPPSIPHVNIILDVTVQYSLNHLIVCDCMFEFWLKVDWFCQQQMVSEHSAYLPMSQYPECQDQTQLMSITLKSKFWFLRNVIPLRIKGFIGSKKTVLNSSDQRLWKKWECCPPYPQFRILFQSIQFVKLAPKACIECLKPFFYAILASFLLISCLIHSKINHSLNVLKAWEVNADSVRLPEVHSVLSGHMGG